MQNIVEKSKEYAIRCHKDTNCLYNGHPYEFHLEMVVNVAVKFIHLVPERLRDIVISGCWTHDTIEDTRQTFNNVMDALGVEVAEIAYALTNEKGKNRKERANEKYYLGIKAVEGATFVKICDRIANIIHSKNVGSDMFKKYTLEQNDFQSHLYQVEYDEMFKYLNNLFYL